MSTDNINIPFIDLASQQKPIRGLIEKRLMNVLDHGKYIMGPEVAELEELLSEFTKVKHSITCSSGTDALYLSLLAGGIGKGDAVFIPSYTFAATAEAVVLCGATPVFIDVDPVCFNIAPSKLDEAISRIKKTNKLNPRAIISVDLFGIPAAYSELCDIASQYSLLLIADAAQSFGGSINGNKVGTHADITTTSFFPSKPLGCYGDGGAIFTDDDDTADIVRSIRAHGGSNQGKYDNVRVGMNARLDTIQAAILIEKLKIFPDELRSRQLIAERYAESLCNVVDVPSVPEGVLSAWAQYTIATDQRDELCAHLKAHDIPTQIYYPKPLHKQLPYQESQAISGELPITDKLSQTLMSLPMHPYLATEVQDRITQCIKLFFDENYA